MLDRIQSLPRPQRILIFILLLVGGLLALVGITLLLIFLTFNNAERNEGLGLLEGVTVSEYAVLPDDNAYPAAIAVDGDGTVYTGSFVTGAIWTLSLDGTVNEIPNTREQIGSVSGLTVGADGDLIVIDQLDADTVTMGGNIQQVSADGTIQPFADGIVPDGFLLPDDVASDAQGNIYVSDRGRGEIWRFAPDGSSGAAWWRLEATSDGRPALTGLAYDASANAIIVTDSNLDAIYSVGVDSAEMTILYRHGNREFPPGLDGVTVSQNGDIYVAAVTQNGIVRLDGDALTYVAGSFRGPSDVDIHDKQLYVTNFDSFSLVVGAIGPRLPFGIDLIQLP